MGDVISATEERSPVANPLHSAEQLTREDRDELYIAQLEYERAAHAAQVLGDRFHEVGRRLLAKYAAQGVEPSTGRLLRSRSGG